MEQFSEAFGTRVQQVLSDAGLGPNTIELLSERRISHTTVRRMGRGYPPSSDHIIEFAEAVGRKLGWTPAQKKELADELLAKVGSKARYHASVRQRAAADARPVAVALNPALGPAG